tara:strand:+ start:1027 stop:1755 length:729 start_codon:yes stop_codon:yes gene_type:complete
MLKYKKTKKICNEIIILKSLQNHTGIARFHEIIHHPQKIILLTEIGETDLFEFSNKFTPINPLSIRKIIKELSSTVKHMSNFGIIHRDIKSENILCFNVTELSNGDIKTGKQYTKLIDFGLSIKYNTLPELETEPQTFKDFCGSPGFFAPEMTGKSGYNQKIDIWSLGAVFLELLITPDKFSEKWMPAYHPSFITKYHVLTTNISRNIKMLLPLVEDKYYELVKCALTIDPEERKLITLNGD